jgi:hypothetical protein
LRTIISAGSVECAAELTQLAHPIIASKSMI